MNNLKQFVLKLLFKDFQLTTEDAGNQTYPGGGIIMRTWNDEI
jgi:hypothetical protein